MSLELLRFKKEFSDTPAFERALHDRVELLGHFHHPSVATIRGVERLGDGGGLALVSKLTPGRRLSLGFRFRQSINVKPGQLTSVTIAVPNGRISINAVPWAEVTIDGNPAGQTPLANLTLPIGTHEVVFRHPQFPEQRQTVVVKADGLTRVSATLQR